MSAAICLNDIGTKSGTLKFNSKGKQTPLELAVFNEKPADASIPENAGNESKPFYCILEVTCQNRRSPNRGTRGNVIVEYVDGATNIVNQSFFVRGSTLLGRSFSTDWVQRKLPVKIIIDFTTVTEKEISVYYSLQMFDEDRSHLSRRKRKITKKHSQSHSLQEIKRSTAADFSETEWKQITEAFLKADVDSSGELDFQEFHEVLKQMYPDITEPDVRRMYCQVDADDSGKIDVDEFLEAVAYYKWDLATLADATSCLQRTNISSAVPKPLPHVPQPPAADQKPATSPQPPPTLTPQLSKDLAFEWEIDFCQLQFGELLGKGAFGSVCKAKWRGIEVAVKRLNASITADVLNEFRKELCILAKLRHPNCVLFMGACTNPSTELCIVTELLSVNLFDLLHERKVNFPLHMKLQIMHQVALGMNYLHLSTPQIIHLDLKSQNLLLDRHLNVKICDFGLSCVKHKTQLLAGFAGSPFWIAPEIISGQSYSEKVDIYSFGICLFEIMTRTIPFRALVTDEASLQKVLQAVSCGKRAPIPQGVPENVSNVIRACWNQTAEKRPTFDLLIKVFEKLLATTPSTGSRP